MKTNLEQLREWHEAAKTRGVVDVKFFPGSSRDRSAEERAGSVLASLARIEKLTGPTL